MSAVPTAGWKPIYPPGSEEGRAFVSRKRAAAASIRLNLCTGVVLLLLASCSRLPPVSAVNLPPIPPASARIWFYRVYDPTESKGQPYIYMNGAIVGISVFPSKATRSTAMFPPGFPGLGRELRAQSLSIPSGCARPRTASLCKDFFSAKLGGIGAEL
jgi:hypothetical protein